MKVTKRDGTVVDYNLTKIQDAIYKAFLACGVDEKDSKDATLMCSLVVDGKLLHEANEYLQVEHIQDVVENVLIEQGFIDIAKAYIKYRNSRTKARNSKLQLNKIIDDLVNIDSADSDEKRENANINADTMCGSLFKVGGAVMKDYFFNHITPKFAQMHFDGKIHIHDSDLAMFAVNCLMIPTGRLLRTGFSTGHGYLRSPKSIGSASTLIAIIIQSSQNDFFGGQAIPTLDYDLAPFVAKSYIRNIAKYLELKLDDDYKFVDNVDEHLKHTFIEPIDNYIDSAEHIIDEEGFETIKYYAEKTIPGGGTLDEDFVNKMHEYARRKTERDTYQAMEALIHNLCTLASRSGGQVPFSSCNFGTDTSEEGRMVSQNFMKAIDAGLGAGETAIFPIAIFKILEGVNTKGCKNYDLYKQSIAVSAKRGFPNWVNVSAPMNLKYYKEGRPETEIATMGCADADELVVWKFHDELRVTVISELWDRCEAMFGIHDRKDNYALIHPTDDYFKIYDSNAKKFVNIKTVIRNDVSTNFRKVEFSNGRSIIVTGDHPLPVEGKGRVFVDDIEIGDKIPAVTSYLFEEKIPYFLRNAPCKWWSEDIYSNLIRMIKFEGIPNYVYVLPMKYKVECLTTLLDKYGCDVSDEQDEKILKSTNRTLALQEALLAEACGIPAEVNECANSACKYYQVKMHCKTVDGKIVVPENRDTETTLVTVTGITVLDKSAPSFDVETESDRFDLSLINSHNCRTRVIGNTYDKNYQQVTGRGNLFFTTINLPYLALEVKENNPSASTEETYQIFLKELDKRIDDCITFSRERFKIACRRKAKNFPFAMGQHLYISSEDLSPDDSIEKAIREGSQSVGFCGLAECLVALFGKHHGESELSQKKGLEIISRMHDLIEEYSEKENVNYSLFATPAEGCAGRLLKACRKRFGLIKGITDRDYLTNSCHVPVYYKISAYDKIRIEAPYHPLCTAGIIGYLELDYDATKNLEAMETLVDAMAKSGMTYFSINHPIDHDPICGYVGHIPVGGVCPRCGRKEGEGVPAGKLLELQSYRPTPEYAIDKDMLEDIDTTTNNI